MAASMWEALVQKYLDFNENAPLSNVISCVQNGEVTLLQLVEFLGPWLTSTEVEKRCRATQLLVEVIVAIPASTLSNKEVELLGSFLCDRVKDHHSIIPHVLQGMAALSCSGALPIAHVKRILADVNRDIHVQSLKQADRRHLYNMLTDLLNSRLIELQSLGSEFVYSFIQILDGETDPRNLLLAFRCASVIAATFPLGTFAEELFEVISCYFPVDFTPPPNDPHGIKKDDLVLGLRHAMAASSKFAEFCLPLLVEKLSSTVLSAKKDAFDTLSACAEVYGSGGLREFLGSLWSCIKREVFTASNEDLKSAALVSLRAILRALATDVLQDEQTSELDRYLKSLFKDLSPYICEHEQRLGQASFELLVSMATSSDAVYVQVVKTTIPKWIEHFENNLQVGPRVASVDKICRVTEAATAVGHKVQASSPLLELRDRLYSFLVSLLSEASAELRVGGLDGINVLLALPGMIEKPEGTAQHLANVVLNCDEADNVRRSAVAPLRLLSQNHPSIITQLVLPLVAERLKQDTVSPDTLLSTVSELAVHEDIVTDILPLLTQRLHMLDKTCGEAEAALAVCTCLQRVVSSTCKHLPCQQLYVKKLWPNILDMLLHGAVSKKYSLFTEILVVKALARVLQLVTQQLHENVASELCSSIVKIFLDGSQDLPSTFLPLNSFAVPQHTQLVHVLCAVLCSLKPGVAIPRVCDVMDQVFRLSCESNHDDTIEGAARCLAGLINKMDQGPELEEMLTSMQDQLRCVVIGGEGEGEGGGGGGGGGDTYSKRRQAITVWIWLTKALVLRGHPGQNNAVQVLLDWLNDPSSLGAYTASGMEVILREYPDILAPDTHANIKFLYRQRLVLYTSALIKEGYSKGAAECRPHFLSALSYQLKYVPKQVLKTELPSLLPLLLESLSCDDESLWQATLATVQSLLTDSPALLSSHVDEITPQLLGLATYKPNMHVRISALRCIGLLSTMDPALLFPHAHRIIRDLQPCLADHKRLVRREAAAARNTWCLMTSGK